MKLKMCGTQSVLTLLALCVGLAHSWDIAVSNGNELKFYTYKTLINTIRFESRSLTALAYDDVRKMILYVDKQNNGDAICGYTLSSVENTCFTERTGRNIHGIAFDSATDTVFFTDTNERTVNSFSLRPGAQNNPRGNLLIKIDEGIPRDIIVDSCKRHVYWLTTDKPYPTIERARVTGAGREVFRILTSLYINTTLTLQPHSLAIDPLTQNIYWYEPRNSTHYHAYSVSVLNNTQKHYVFYLPLQSFPILIHPSNTFAVVNSLFFTVDFRVYNSKERVYVFKKRQFGRTGLVAETITAYDGAYTTLPVGIVANYQITEQNQDKLDCEIF